VKQADKYWERQKWLIIYNAMIDPRPAGIARHRSVKKFVRQNQQYNRQGEAAVSRPGKGGRRNCYLSWEQEQRLIESFKESA